MAYAPRPDGLNDLILDDGTRIASPLPIAQLEEMGHRPIPPMPQAPGLDPNAVAGPGGAPDWQSAVPQSDAGVPQQFFQRQGGHSGMAPASAYAELPAQAGASPEQQVERARLDAENNARQAEDAKRRASRAYAAANAPPGAAAPKRNLVPLGGAAPGQGGEMPAYAPQRVTKIKGGDVRASFTRVPGQEVPADVKEDAINDDPENLELSAEDVTMQREELRQKRELQLLDQQKMLDRQQAQRAHVDQQIAGKQSMIDQRDREIEKTRPQTIAEVIDDRGFLGRVGAALIMAVGGYNAGLNGGPNQGYQLVRESIMDEVNSQRAAYEDAKERGETARNDYARAIAIYGTPEAASLDMEMRRIGVAEKVLENRASKIQDTEYLQQASQVANQLRQQRAETKMKLFDLEKGKVTQENWQYVPDRYVVSGGAPKVKKEDGQRQVTLPDGSRAYALDPERSRKLQDVVKANASLAELAGRLKSLTDTVGKREPTAAERAAAETIKSQMMFTFKDASQAGALDKGLQDAMDTYFGKPEEMFRIKDAGRKLDEVRRIANGKINDVRRYDLRATTDYDSPSAPMPPPHESDE